MNQDVKDAHPVPQASRLDASDEARKAAKETIEPTPATTIGCYLNGSKRMYTYQCARPVNPGDKVNVKLPHGGIITVNVEVVHDEPQLSDKWETKWCVVVQTAAEYAASLQQSSDLGKELGL